MRTVGLSILGIVMISVVAFAADGIVSGRWNTNLTIDPDSPLLDSLHLASFIDLDYTLRQVAFGLLLSTDAVSHGLTGGPPYWAGEYPMTVLADSYGRLGPFAYVSSLWFDVENSQFRSWVNAAWIEVSGVEFFSMFFVDGIDDSAFLIDPYTGLSYGLQGAKGMGGTFGASGQSEHLVLSIEAGISTRYTLKVFGPEGQWLDYMSRAHEDALGRGWIYYEDPVGARNAFRDLGCDEALMFSVYAPQVVQTECRSALEFVNVQGTFLFPCFSVSTRASFTCAEGFSTLSVSTGFLEMPGFPWLRVSPRLFFTAEEKRFLGFASLDFGGLGCITPFFRINGPLGAGIFGPGDPVLEQIALVGLFFETEFGSVVVRAGSKFSDNAYMRFDRRGNPRTIPPDQILLTPSTIPPVYRNCEWPPSEYDEFIGILTRNDACCGHVDMSAFVWFNDISDGGPPVSSWLFNIAEVDLDLSYALTPRADIRFGIEVTEPDGVSELLFGFGMAF